MFKDAFFVKERHLGAKAVALPAAALVHVVALSLALVLPLLRMGDVPRIEVSDVIVAPALPKTPLPPPKGRAGSPGGRISPRAVPATAASWSVAPIYPEIARQARIEGIVIIEATTDIYGRVIDVKVLRSIPLLDQAAIDAVRQWVYEPMIINGRPRPVIFTVTVRFQLK